LFARKIFVSQRPSLRGAQRRSNPQVYSNPNRNGSLRSLWPLAMTAFRIFCLVFVGMLSACGFEPLYGPQSSQRPEVCEQLAQIKVARIPDREGQILRNHLIDILSPNGQPVFPAACLNVQLIKTKVDVNVRKDGTAMRYKITLVANISLCDPETNQMFYTDRATVVNAYYIGGNTAVAAYSTVISERDAVKKALKLLAENIQLLLASYYKQNCVNANEDPEAT
jgi:LPS-assembly lipoprotein